MFRLLCLHETQSLFHPLNLRVCQVIHQVLFLLANLLLNRLPIPLFYHLVNRHVGLLLCHHQLQAAQAHSLVGSRNRPRRHSRLINQLFGPLLCQRDNRRYSQPLSPLRYQPFSQVQGQVVFHPRNLPSSQLAHPVKFRRRSLLFDLPGNRRFDPVLCRRVQPQCPRASLEAALPDNPQRNH